MRISMLMLLDRVASCGVVDLGGFLQFLQTVSGCPKDEALEILLHSECCAVDCSRFADWLGGAQEQEHELPPQTQTPTKTTTTATTAAAAAAGEAAVKQTLRHEVSLWSWAHQEAFREKLDMLLQHGVDVGQLTIQDLKEVLQELEDRIQIWRNVRYGQENDRKLKIFPEPSETLGPPVREVAFGARLRVLQERDIGEEKWLHLPGKQWALARRRDGVVQCLQMPTRRLRASRTPEEAFNGQRFPERGMYSEGYPGGAKVCLISASGEALWREVNLEMLAHDIATSTAFHDPQWGGYHDLEEWVTHYSTSVVELGRLGTGESKDLFVTVRHSENWRRFVGDGLAGPDVATVREDIGRAQYRECEWLCKFCKSQAHLNLAWSEVHFVTAFTFLRKHCGWTEKDCQQVATAKLLSFAGTRSFSNRESQRREAETHYWRCDEAFGGAWPEELRDALLSLCLTAPQLWPRWPVGVEWQRCEESRLQSLRAERPRLLVGAVLAEGLAHTLLLLPRSGEVLGWGDNYFGQCEVPALPQCRRFVMLAAGAGFSLGLTDAGELLGWGKNNLKQCEPPQPPSGQRFVSVAAGYEHGLAITDAGELLCWGNQEDGRCQPPQLQPGERYVAVAAEGRHSVALTSSGAAISWGLTVAETEACDHDCEETRKTNRTHDYDCDENCRTREDGQIACPPSSQRFVAVAAGLRHGLGLTENGEAVCWGHDNVGQCQPPRLPEGQHLVALAGGCAHSVGLTNSGEIYGWGNHNHGRCHAPPLPPGEQFTAVVASGYRTVGLTSRGELRCWGGNYCGQCEPPAELDRDLSQLEARAALRVQS